MFHFVINWFITTVSLLTLAKLPLRLESKGIRTAAFAAFRLGRPDTRFRPVRTALVASSQWITFGLLSIGLTSLIFWITPNLLDGFHVHTGIVSAFINPIALSLLNPWLIWFLH